MTLPSLSDLIPVVYRWIIVGVLMAAFGGFCYLKGAEHEMARGEKIEQARQDNELRIGHLRQVVTEKIIKQFLPAITKIETITKTITEKVNVYVKDSDPVLSGGFRVYFDSAVTGTIPDPSRIPDAAPVAAKDVATTISEDAGLCLADQKRLEGLQQWVRDQQAVK